MSERFWSRVVKSDGCWEWSGSCFKSGYGAFWRDGGMRYTHRESYEMTNGPVPTGLQVLHSCDNRRCVNPNHLRAGTSRENMQDAIDRSRLRHGARHPCAKLTHQQVVALKERWVCGEKTSILARECGVSQSAVCNIIKGRSWRSARYDAA